MDRIQRAQEIKTVDFSTTGLQNEINTQVKRLESYDSASEARNILMKIAENIYNKGYWGLSDFLEGIVAYKRHGFDLAWHTDPDGKREHSFLNSHADCEILKRRIGNKAKHLR